MNFQILNDISQQTNRSHVILSSSYSIMLQHTNIMLRIVIKNNNFAPKWNLNETKTQRFYDISIEIYRIQHLLKHVNSFVAQFAW